ncbi:MAG: SET domain-containing protein [Candidatus Komeilibacteria bacterium]|nr:SET domain-containing protein [Candidatus Komeilibacteria bacterium]
MKQVYVGRSKIAGLGVVAGKDFKKGKLVTTVRGPVRYIRVETKKQAQKHAVWIGRTKYTWFDPRPPLHRLNHSCDPNTGIRGKTRMYALRDIKKGEEITIDYSTIEPQPLWSMPCSCRTKKCRKVVRSIEFLPYTTYRKYLPYIPTYFQSMYKKSRRQKRT